MESWLANPQKFIFAPGFPPLLFHDPEYSAPHRAGAAFLRKDKVEDLVHTAVAHTQQGVQFPEYYPLFDLFEHRFSVWKKAEIHDRTPP
jgi:hypothetical protein